ncbi:hypothetical protein ACB317_28920, partial [Citrobacter portucalensis]
YGPQNDVTLKMPAFEWVHVQLHQQKGMISLSPPTICNSAIFFYSITSPFYFFHSGLKANGMKTFGFLRKNGVAGLIQVVTDTFLLKKPWRRIFSLFQAAS